MNTWRSKMSVLFLSAVVSANTYAIDGVLPVLASPVASASIPSKAATGMPEAAAAMALGSADFTDGWWVPTESGWGLNILHQRNTLAMTFYVYNDANEPVWYLGIANFVSEAVGYQGTLSRSTGPGFSLPEFGPILSVSAQVGTITFRPTSVYTADLSYNVGTIVVTKKMARIAFGSIEYAGAFFGGMAGTRSGCPLGNATPFEGAVFATSSVNNGVAQLVLQNGTQSCTLSGAFVQMGKLGTVPNGSYVCSSGVSGTATINEWAVNRSGMTAAYTTQTGTCLESGHVAAARRS